ncbi:hypothetical protein DFA_11843 [Cavenderia fasciculata]|uniref:RNA polymerase II assembly factor Rtp1 C-terminal domain-containing protein n=1 Tax=Cavenderia fasciculata TaxID=261658 RepID=F4QED3_CACFS|nr:uncharacterized protein DFA_11843 [Cavenderia fasciculata]EGG14080.1 hypothetical protein DFA_11843 [Cavenderia fasciculata]|eukprot:XP_004350788.1 hypothetical protein DFA_11843 [Cavenderia fasciculata]
MNINQQVQKRIEWLQDLISPLSSHREKNGGGGDDAQRNILKQNLVQHLLTITTLHQQQQQQSHIQQQLQDVSLVSPSDLENLSLNDEQENSHSNSIIDGNDGDNDIETNIIINSYKNQLKECIQLLKYNDDQNNQNNKYGEDIYFIQLEYVFYIQHLLLDITNLLEKDLNVILSINSQKTIKLAMDIVVCWGISPCLVRGLGFPIGQRGTPISKEMVALGGSSPYFNKNQLLSYKINNGYISNLLYIIIQQFLRMRSNIDINSIILSRYISDIFATLIQLLNINQQSSLNDKDQTYCKDQIDNILFGIHPELIFENLTLLLSPQYDERENKSIAPPVFVVKVVNLLLSKCLTRPHSLKVVLGTILSPQPGKDQKSSIDRLVNLITTCPLSIQPKEYYSKISKQLIDLLHVKDKERGRLIECVITIIEKMLELEPKLTLEYVIDPIIKPLLLFQQYQPTIETTTTNETMVDDENVKEEETIIKEVDIFYCLEDLHKILTVLSLNQTLLEHLTNVIPILFQLQCFLSKSISSLKISCKEILSTYFKFYNRSVAQLKHLILPEKLHQQQDRMEIDQSQSSSSSSTTSPTKQPIYLEINQPTVEENDSTAIKCLSFAMGESGGVVAKYIDYYERDFSWEAECIVDILKQMKNESLAGDLFVDLVNEFAMVEKNVKKKDSKRYFVLMQLIIVLSEGMGAAALKNVVQVATFVKVILQREIDSMTKRMKKLSSGKAVSVESEQEENEQVDTITLALGILSTMLSGEVKVRKEEEILVYDLVGCLEQLSQHPNDIVSVMSSQLKTIIDVKKPTWSMGSSDNDSSSSSSVNPNDKLKEILDDLSHPLLPVRAHGLIELRRLVLSMRSNKNNDNIVKRNLDNIITIFKTQLNDDDTFIYTCSINGLSSIGDIYPNDIIPILIDQFKETNKNKEEKRMKIGESLVQISQRCGDTLPYYAPSLMNCFLVGCRDKRVGVRASSLSNLATMCELLKSFGIDQYLVEILSCLNSMLTSEREIEVRRGAIFVYQLLLRGFGLDAFNQGSSMSQELQTTYRQLKYLESTDPDPVCKFHARTALSELETITKEFIFPNQSNEKE